MWGSQPRYLVNSFMFFKVCCPASCPWGHCCWSGLWNFVPLHIIFVGGAVLWWSQCCVKVNFMVLFRPYDRENGLLTPNQNPWESGLWATVLMALGIEWEGMNSKSILSFLAFPAHSSQNFLHKHYWSLMLSEQSLWFLGVRSSHNHPLLFLWQSCLLSAWWLISPALLLQAPCQTDPPGPPSVTFFSSNPLVQPVLALLFLSSHHSQLS